MRGYLIDLRSWSLSVGMEENPQLPCLCPPPAFPLYALFQSQAPATSPDHFNLKEILQEVQCPLPGGPGVFPYISSLGWLYLTLSLFPQYLSVPYIPQSLLVRGAYHSFKAAQFPSSLILLLIRGARLVVCVLPNCCRLH